MLKLFDLLNGTRLRKKNVFLQYSNQEQFTGDYWVDGKKIYCKTIYASVTGVNAKIPHNVSNIGSYKCIDYSNTFIDGGSQSFMAIQVYDSSSLSNFFSFHNITDKEITFRTGTAWLGPWNLYITIRYTKN